MRGSPLLPGASSESAWRKTRGSGVLFIMNSEDSTLGAQGQEKVLWTGRPKQGILFSLRDLFRIPLAIGNAAIIILVMYSLLTHDYQILFSCIVYVLFGYAYVFGGLVTDRKRRTETKYEITSDRVIVRRRPNFFADAMTSFSLNTLTNVSSTHFRDGTGTIYFWDSTFGKLPGRRLTKWRASLVAGNRSAAQGASIVFERIADPDAVLDLIRQLQAPLSDQARHSVSNELEHSIGVV